MFRNNDDSPEADLVAYLQELPQAGEGEEAAHSVVTLRQMASATLGTAGSVAVSAVYLLLSYSLITAYVAKVRKKHQVVYTCAGYTNSIKSVWGRSLLEIFLQAHRTH